VAAAQLESRRVAERLVRDGLNVVRDVRLAYIDLVLAQRRHQLAEDGWRLRSRLARIAEARLKAGAVSELDVSAMRLDALFSEEEAVRTAHEVELARHRLQFLIGLPASEIEVDTAAPGEVPPVELDVDALVCEAVASRPDLRAVKLALAAACQRVRLAQSDYFNVAAALPDINSKGDKGFEAGSGLKMTLPILHQNQGQIALARAEVERLQRRCHTLRESIALEVRQAHTRLVQAQRDLAIWREKVLPQAEQAVASARKALEEDGVSLLLVLETTRQLLDASARELQASADVRRAVAELERSVGRRLLHEAIVNEEGEGEEILAPQPDASLQEVTP